MIIDAISDLHGHLPELQGGDLLIVAGDLTAKNKPYEYIQFGLWLNQQKYKKKIVIAGNHDRILESFPEVLREVDPLNLVMPWTYLCDSGTEFDGLKIWGSPWTLSFPGMNPHCKAFTVDTEKELAEKWALIPEDTDILITHSPPHGCLDLNDKKENCGSHALCNYMMRIQPILSVYGHIHESYGTTNLFIPSSRYIGMVDCKMVNASHVNKRYQPVNKPIRVIL